MSRSLACGAHRLDLATEYSSWAIVAALLRCHVVQNLVSYATVLRCHGERGAKAEAMLGAMDRRVLPPYAPGARAVRRRRRFSGELTRRQANGIPCMSQCYRAWVDTAAA